MGRRAFGSVEKLPSGRYRAVYRVRQLGGKKFSAPETFRTIKDADVWLANEQTKLANGTWEPPRVVAAKQTQAVALTFREYSADVIKNRKLEETTRSGYQDMLDRLILPKFGDLTLAAISPLAVKNWHATMSATPTQQANTYGFFKSVLAEAVRDDLLAKNPCNVRAGSQKRRSKEPEIISPAEFKEYLGVIPEKYQPLFLLAYWCGLRSGELRGLRRKDLNLKNETLTIHQAVVKVRGKAYQTKGPKSEAGTRELDLPPHLVPILKDWIKNQPVTGQDAYLFTARDGKTALSSQTFSNMHIRARSAIKRPGFTPHGLRHSAATLASQQGATTAELMDWFGWDTPAMAARYSHAERQRKRELAEKLSQLAK